MYNVGGYYYNPSQGDGSYTPNPGGASGSWGDSTTPQSSGSLWDTIVTDVDDFGSAIGHGIGTAVTSVENAATTLYDDITGNVKTVETILLVGFGLVVASYVIKYRAK